MVRSLVPWGFGAPQVFERFRREMDQLFSDFLGNENGGEHVLAFAPRTNVAETDTHYELTVDLPGLKADDFTVELKDGNLWISGERKEETEQKGKTWHRIERQYGHFRRVFPLGADVDPDRIEAEYKDGVLRVTVPKSEAMRPKKIEVKA
ncbi:MAG: Hsp20/alpha crystallin family protein [Thermoguttaceae bacterium]|jgi:HSP20 family protein|nr:Hsp20/alpha crystallin family protein [Thermoguttaceae bacterium]